MMQRTSKIITGLMLGAGVMIAQSSHAMTQTMSTLAPSSESVLHEFDELKLALSGSVYTTKENFSASRSKEALPNNGKLSLLKGVLGFDYGFSSRVSAFFDFSFQHTSVSTNSVLYPQYTYYGTSDYDLGFRYALARGKTDWMLEVGLQMPAYTRLAASSWGVLNSASSLPTGSGLIEPWLYTGIEYPLSASLYLGSGLGAKMRTQSYSSEGHASLYLKFVSKRDFFVKLGAVTEMPLQETATVNSNQVLSGSLAMNTNNYSWIKSDVALGYYFSRSFYSSATFQNEFWGKNTSNGLSASLSLGMHFGASDDEKPSLARKARSTEKKFHQYYLTGSLIKLNKNSKQCLIDKGRNDGVAPGVFFDIFAPNSGDGAQGELAGRGKVLESGPTRSKLQIIEQYSESDIEEGFVVRKSID